LGSITAQEEIVPHEKIFELTGAGALALVIIQNLRNIFTEINMASGIFDFLALGKPMIPPLQPSGFFLKRISDVCRTRELRKPCREFEYRYAHRPN